MAQWLCGVRLCVQLLNLVSQAFYQSQVLYKHSSKMVSTSRKRKIENTAHTQSYTKILVMQSINFVLRPIVLTMLRCSHCCSNKTFPFSFYPKSNSIQFSFEIFFGSIFFAVLNNADCNQLHKFDRCPAMDPVQWLSSQHVSNGINSKIIYTFTPWSQPYHSVRSSF